MLWTMTGTGNRKSALATPHAPKYQSKKISNLPTGSQTDNYLTFGLETNFITILTGPLSHLKI